MPELYVDSGSGSDTAGAGDSAAAPLRSLSFAVDEAARRFGSDRTTIRLAGGSYAAATGERFPIEMPQNLSVLGAGPGSTIIRFERSLTDGYEEALSGGEELGGFTLQGMPLDVSGCYSSTGIVQTMGSAYLHDLVVEPAPGAPAGEVAFGLGIGAGDDARVQRVTVRGCSSGLFFGGTSEVSASTFIDNDRTGVGAWGGTITDCDIAGNHIGLHIYSNGSGAVASGNRIRDNTWGAQLSGTAAPVAELRRNLLERNWYGIAVWGEGLVEGNDLRVARGHIGVTVLLYFPVRDRTTAPAGTVVRPVFRNNGFLRTAPSNRSHRPMPLAMIGGAAQPVFEGNRFWTEDGTHTQIVEVYHDALPDFGGGGESVGNNRFESGWWKIVQDGFSPRREIFARNNVWHRVPPRQGFGRYVTLEWYVEPDSRRSSVTLRTEGARSL